MLPSKLLSALTRALRHAAPLAMLVALAMTTLACMPPYQIIAQSGPPSALAGATAMTIQYDYSQIAISDKRMSEQQWLDTREKDEHRQTYLETKDSANIGFGEGLQKKIAGVEFATGQAPAGTIQITVVYTEWEEGMYAGVVAWNSKITARVVFSRDGQVVDEIQIHVEEAATLGTPAPQQRLHTCGRRLGELAAHYIINTTK
ncbi:hypothetical protein ACNOYE_19565 [Nannocystaceae bacterium ST9]